MYNVGDAASLFNSLILQGDYSRDNIMFGISLHPVHQNSYSRAINTDHFGTKLSAWNFWFQSLEQWKNCKHRNISVYLDSAKPAIIFGISKPTTVDYGSFNSILFQHKSIMCFRMVFLLGYLPVPNPLCSYPSLELVRHLTLFCPTPFLSCHESHFSSNPSNLVHLQVWWGLPLSCTSPVGFILAPSSLRLSGPLNVGPTPPKLIVLSPPLSVVACPSFFESLPLQFPWGHRPPNLQDVSRVLVDEYLQFSW